MELFENENRPAKNDPAWRDLTFSLFPPRPVKKNHPQPTQKRLPIKFPITNELTQG